MDNEEIEKAKECLNEIKNSFREFKDCENVLYPLDKIQFNKIEDYIHHLETKVKELEEREQKIKSFLENGIKSVQECYEEMLTDIGGIKVINVTGLSRKEKEEVTNKSNCLIVQEHCYKEILDIYKEENNE